MASWPHPWCCLSSSSRTKDRFKPAAATLAAVHVFAIMLAFAISDPSFTP
ncbi:MAG TPA: hypothetical protein VGD96_11015 [Bradyrhizobium sp.]